MVQPYLEGIVLKHVVDRLVEKRLTLNLERQQYLVQTIDSEGVRGDFLKFTAITDMEEPQKIEVFWIGWLPYDVFFPNLAEKIRLKPWRDLQTKECSIGPRSRQM